MNEIQPYNVMNSEELLQVKAHSLIDSLDIAELSRGDYKSRIGLFLEFIQENPFNQNTFLDYKRHLNSRRDFSVSTKAKYLTVARVFLRELNRQGVIPVDVTMNVKSFEQSKKHKRFGITQDEVCVLMQKIDSLPSDIQGLRLGAIVSLLLYQGLRQIEVVRLTVEDLDLSRQVAFVLGKGRDDKEAIDLHPKTVEALRKYMDVCRVRSGALFFSISNNGRNNRLTTKSVREMVTSFLKESGIQNTTHGFRHFFTTKLIEHFSNDLLTVAKFTRHKSIETLQVYNDNISKKGNLPKYYQAFAS